MVLTSLGIPDAHRRIGARRCQGLAVRRPADAPDRTGSQPVTEAGFPTVRPRRLRQHPLLRQLVRETRLQVSNLILPLFIRPGRGVRKEIASMPGNYQLSTDCLVEEVGKAVELGLRDLKRIKLKWSSA